ASAEQRLAATATALEKLRREHAAAHAARGLKAGDPCPICRQNIPAGFKPPQARAERAAQRAHREAEAAAQEAREARATSAATCAQVERTIEEASSNAKESKREAAVALKHARATLGQIDPASTDTELVH